MQKSKKIKYIIIAIIILLAVVGAIALIIKNTDRTKIYDNVRVISDESGQNELLVNVEADRLIFKENPGYVTGDVLVSGITENTPDGFIRKVVSVSQEGDQYILETEPGLITDVFEEVHVEKTFLLSEEGATEVKSSGIGYSNSLNDIITSSIATATGITRSNDPLFDDDGDYVFNVEEEFDIANVLSVETEVGFGLQLDFKLEIEKGDVVLGLTVHNAVGGEIFLGLSEELKKEFEKELLSKMLPSIQFMVGYVPVVITNEVSIALEGEANISGKLGTTIELEAEKIVGFEYNSATNKIVEINEDNYLADGTKWSVGGSVKGEVEAGVYVHLTSKLYGSTGIDLAAGIKGSASAELASTVDTDGSYEDCIGRIDLEVGPELEGSIVVTVPIVDYELVDCKIFETDLPAFWEEHWVSSENWEEDSEKVEVEDIEVKEEEQEIGEIKGDVDTYFAIIDGVKYTFPFKVTELEKLGYDLTECENVVLSPPSDKLLPFSLHGEVNESKEPVLIYNPYGVDMKAIDCVVFGLYGRREGEILEGITIGTSEERVKAVYEVYAEYSKPVEYDGVTTIYRICVADDSLGMGGYEIRVINGEVYAYGLYNHDATITYPIEFIEENEEEDAENYNSEENDAVEVFSPEVNDNVEPFYISAGGNRFTVPIQLSELEQYGFDFTLCENETVRPNEIATPVLIYNGELWFFEVYNDGESVRNAKECTAIGVTFLLDNELEQELYLEEGFTVAKGMVMDQICLGLDRQTVEEICYEKYDGFIAEDETMLGILVPRTENYADMLVMEFDDDNKVIGIEVISVEYE